MVKKENKQTYIQIFLFLLSVVLGFALPYFLNITPLTNYILLSCFISMALAILCVSLLHLYTIKARRRYLRSCLKRGSYSEVLEHVKEQDKAFAWFWEYRLLALFHAGHCEEFKKLYSTYMNEINENSTIERFEISILYDLLFISENDKKPITFMKNDTKKTYAYMKRIDYQILMDIRLGIQAYYSPQKKQVKQYFEKFMQQVDVLSKPLGFYLYSIVLRAMLEGGHQHYKIYEERTQQFIFDDRSYQLFNQIIKGSVGKGNNQNDMDRQAEKNRHGIRSEVDQSSNDLNRSFDYQRPQFQNTTSHQAEFVKRRHANEYQSDFDALNASVQDHENFNLYEDVAFQDVVSKNANSRDEAYQQKQRYDEIDDLDPTWFARRSMDADPFSSSSPYPQSNSPINPSPSRLQRQRQETNFTPSSPLEETQANNHIPRARQPMQAHQPEFMNQRQQNIAQPTTTLSMGMPRNNNAQRGDPRAPFQNKQAYQEPTANTPSRLQPNDTQQRTQSKLVQPSNPMMQPTTTQPSNPMMQPTTTQPSNPMMQQTNVMGKQTPQQQVPMRRQGVTRQSSFATPEENDRFSRFNQAEPQDLQPQIQSTNVKEERTRSSMHRKNRQDPFGFENPNAIARDLNSQKNITKNERVEGKTKTNINTRGLDFDPKKFVKFNISLFFFTLLDASIVSIATSSFVYNYFFHKYAIDADVIPKVILLAFIVALLISYLTAGVHTGYTMLRKPLQSWSFIVKVIVSPLLLIVATLIGAVCEIPYLILNSIKANK